MSSRPALVARHRALAAVAACVAALTLGTAPADARPGEEPSTQPPTAERGPQAGRAVGFSPGGEILDASPASLRRQLAKMRALGVRRLRIDVSWARIEHSRGHFNWADTDRVVREARAAGLRVLGILCYEPEWAKAVDDSGRPQPVSPAAFATFAGAAAERYAGRVSAWEIWNEPNLRHFWGSQPNPKAYARLVKAGARQIRSHAPEATVVVGALAPAVDAADGSEVSPEKFLRGLYGSVSKLGLFDAVSIHPYSYPAMPDGDQEWNTFNRLPAIHQLMREYGDGGTSLWLTEYGAPTGRSDRAVSPRRQATMMVKALREARRLDFVGPLYLFSFRDSQVAPYDLEANFGVVKHHGRPKAAFWALRRALRTR